jgi:hypothetical protein
MSALPVIFCRIKKFAAWVFPAVAMSCGTGFTAKKT